MTRVARMVLALALGAAVLALPGRAWAAPVRPHVVTVRILTVRIVTVPPTPGARFAVDGRALATDAQGVARFTVPKNLSTHRLQLLNPAITSGTAESVFTRWWGQKDRAKDFAPVITGLQIRRNTVLQVGFKVRTVVRYRFTDQASQLVDPSRITSLTVRGDSGEQQTVEGRGTITLVAVRPKLERSALVAKEPIYSVQSVVIDGANVVNANEQRFRPSQKTDLTFVVLLRQVQFRTHDLLFGNSIGSAIHITYPDGRSRLLAFNGDHQLVLEKLARGNYKVKVVGLGYSSGQIVALSRSQHVDLPVVSYLDMAIGGVVALFVIAALLFFRGIRTADIRPGLRRMRIPDIRPGLRAIRIPDIRPGLRAIRIPDIRPGLRAIRIPDIRPGLRAIRVPDVRPGLRRLLARVRP